MDRPGVRQVTEGSGEQGTLEETGCKIICGAPTTLAVRAYFHNDKNKIFYHLCTETKRPPHASL